jgi:hypothetical protein
MVVDSRTSKVVCSPSDSQELDLLLRNQSWHPPTLPLEATASLVLA